MTGRAHWRPTARGIGLGATAAATFAAGAAYDSHQLLVIAGGLTAVVVGSASWFVLGVPRRVAAFTRASPAVVAAGEPAEVVAVARETRSVLRIDPARGLWVNAAGVVAGATGVRRGWLAPSPAGLDPLRPSDGACAATAWVPTAHRGLLVLPERRIWVHDPLGLVGRPCAAVPPVTVAVHPIPTRADVGITRPAPATADGSPSTVAGRGVGELLGVRPYTAGDPLHLVHWPSLARPGPPLVKEFDAEAGHERCVLVDDRAGVHGRASFESMLSTACGLVLAATRAGCPVVLATWSGLEVRVGTDSGDLGRALVALAAMSPRTTAGARLPAGPLVTVTSTAAATALPPPLAASGPVLALP